MTVSTAMKLCGTVCREEREPTDGNNRQVLLPAFGFLAYKENILIPVAALGRVSIT